MFGNYSHDGVSHATCAFCVRTWDKMGSELKTSIDLPLSIDAARHIAQTLASLDGQAKITCTTTGHDYQECLSVCGYHRGTLGATTMVSV